MYTEPCHVGHFGAFSKAMHINGPVIHSCCLSAHGGVCILNVRLFLKHMHCKLRLRVVTVSTVPVALFSHEKNKSTRCRKNHELPMDEMITIGEV